MNDKETIISRIQAFIKDHDQWERDCMARRSLSGNTRLPCELIDEQGNFEISESFINETHLDENRDSLAALAREHCVEPGVLLVHGIKFSFPPAHSSEFETIEQITIKGDCAFVESQLSNNQSVGYEYHLEKRGTDWKIVKLDEFYSSKHVSSEKREWPDSAFRTNFSFADDVGLDFTRAFRPGEKIYNQEACKVEEISTETVGEIDLPSGMLVVHNPMEDPDRAEPLEFKIPSPRLKVEVARAGYHNAFVRVTFAENAKSASAFVPARLAGTSEDDLGAVVGTRCGYIVLSDAVAWTSQSARAAEKLRDRSTNANPRNRKREHVLLEQTPGRNPLTAALINRGGGDFDTYCYWALDDAAAPIALIIDLRVCGRYVEKEHKIPVTSRLFKDPNYHVQLQELGQNMRFEHEQGQIIVHSKDHDVSKVDLVDRDGEILASTENSGYHTSDDTDRLTFIRDVPEVIAGLNLRVHWKVWRNEIEISQAF